MSTALRIAALCGGALLLAACGQRGALYIPEPRGEPVAQPAASPAQAPADEDEQERARREAAGGAVN